MHTLIEEEILGKRITNCMATLTAAVNFNTSQNCILGFLWSHMPLNIMLQRNLMLGYQEISVL